METNSDEENLMKKNICKKFSGFVKLRTEKGRVLFLKI